MGQLHGTTSISEPIYVSPNQVEPPVSTVGVDPHLLEISLLTIADNNEQQRFTNVVMDAHKDSSATPSSSMSSNENQLLLE